MLSASSRFAGSIVALTFAALLGVSVIKTPATTLVIVATLLVLVVFARDSRKTLGVFNPMLPILLVMITSALIPALQGRFSGGTQYGASAGANTSAAVYFSLFVVIAVLTYLLLGRRTSPGGNVPDDTTEGIAWTPSRALFAWSAAASIGAVGLYLLVQNQGGVSAYVFALSDRTRSLAGQGTLILLLLLPAGSSLVLLSAFWSYYRQRSPGLTRRLLFTLVPVVISAGFLLATGNRMNLMVYFGALAYLRNRLLKRWSTRQVAAGVLLGVFVGLGILPLLRSSDDVSNRRFDLTAWQAAYTDFGPVQTFGQEPAIALMLDHKTTRTYGLTYVAASTILLPRSIAPWKLPDVGEVVTKEVLPTFWYDRGTGIQVGAPGEAIKNFGLLGIPIVGIIAGIGLIGLGRLGGGQSIVSVLVYAVVLPRVALYLRGGFANVTAYLVMDLLVLYASIRLVNSPRKLSHEPVTPSSSACFQTLSTSSP